MSLATVNHARLEWQPDGTPYNNDYGDVYFSRDGGLAESRHVYLHANQLPDRWHSHFLSHRFFVIAEAGFGTGLNFLATATDFQQQPTHHGELWYYAIERSPLSPSDLQRALQAFPEFGSLTNELLQRYPLRFKGWHHLRFRRVHLILIFDDIVNALAQLRNSNVRVDTWYLDAFAPNVNPDMWTNSVLLSIGKLSQSGATASTYSVAGAIRRGLEVAGFDVQKRAGFGRKREMTVAKLREHKPRHESVADHNHRTVHIVGGGIAGCALAAELARYDVNVTLYEKERIGGVLADHPAAIACPRWTRDHSVDTQWQLQGLLRLDQCLRDEPFASALLYRGLVEYNDFDQDDFEKLGLLSDIVASADSATTERAWLQHLAITIQPEKLCLSLCQHSRINIVHAEYCYKPDQLVVYCNSHFSRQRLPNVPFAVTRGQMTLLKLSGTAPLPHPVSRDEQYRILLPQQELLIGSTFDRDDEDLSIRKTSHQSNLAKLKVRLSPSVVETMSIVAGFTGLRLSTRDHNPICDRLDATQYLNIGHGSHGLMSAFSAAAKIRSRLLGQPDCMPSALQQKSRLSRYA